MALKFQVSKTHVFQGTAFRLRLWGAFFLVALAVMLIQRRSHDPQPQLALIDLPPSAEPGASAHATLKPDSFFSKRSSSTTRDPNLDLEPTSDEFDDRPTLRLREKDVREPAASQGYRQPDDYSQQPDDFPRRDTLPEDLRERTNSRWQSKNPEFNEYRQQDPIESPSRSRVAAVVERNRTFVEPTASELLSTRLPAGLFDTVRDHTVGIRAEEASPFFYLLARARTMPAGEMARSSLGQVPFTELMSNPDRYRGHVVTMIGTMRRLNSFRAKSNEYRLNPLYEGWVFTPDSGNHPLRVVFTALPESFEPSSEMRVDVRITGYFFKLEGYASHSGLQLAPVLLARRIERYQHPTLSHEQVAQSSWFFGGLAGAGLVFGLVVVGWNAFDPSYSSRRRYEQTPWQERASLEALAGMRTESVQEGLAALERDLNHRWTLPEPHEARAVREPLVREIQMSPPPLPAAWSSNHSHAHTTIATTTTNATTGFDTAFPRIPPLRELQPPQERQLSSEYEPRTVVPPLKVGRRHVEVSSPMSPAPRLDVRPTHKTLPKGSPTRTMSLADDDLLPPRLIPPLSPERSS